MSRQAGVTACHYEGMPACRLDGKLADPPAPPALGCYASTLASQHAGKKACRGAGLPHGLACRHASAQVALECVEAYAEGRVNRRVLAGSPVTRGFWKVGSDGVQRRLLGFPAGGRFVLDMWERNDYGTTRWRVVVARAAWPGEAVELLPAVRPGAVVLADIQGAQRVRAFLAWLRQNGDRIERFSAAELARIELHFLRAPLARLRTSSKGVRHAK